VLKEGRVPPPVLVPPTKISRWYKLQWGVDRGGKFVGSDIEIFKLFVVLILIAYLHFPVSF